MADHVEPTLNGTVTRSLNGSGPGADAIRVVRTFLDAMESGATEEAVALLHPDVVWKNTTLPDVRGERRVAGALRGLERPWLGFAVEIHHIAAEGAVVLTDRTDVLRFGPVSVRFWVMGTFVLREGRIVLWHDHFSWENFVRGTVGGVLRAVFARR